MNGCKILLITAEVCAIICLILLQLVPTTCDTDIKVTFTIMFALAAVGLQSCQQEIKWQI